MELDPQPENLLWLAIAGTWTLIGAVFKVLSGRVKDLKDDSDRDDGSLWVEMNGVKNALAAHKEYVAGHTVQRVEYRADVAKLMDNQVKDREMILAEIRRLGEQVRVKR